MMYVIIWRWMIGARRNEFFLSHTHSSTHVVTACDNSTKREDTSYVTLVDIGCRRLIGCLTLQVIFRKRATNYRALLREMTCKDKASYDSTPLCITHFRNTSLTTVSPKSLWHISRRCNPKKRNWFLSWVRDVWRDLLRRTSRGSTLKPKHSTFDTRGLQLKTNIVWQNKYCLTIKKQ